MKNALLTTLFALSAAAAHAENFKITSASWAEGGTLSNRQVANVFGCKGDNLSPQVSWANAPEGTQSFAITVYDPDAPTGSGWWHWTAFNIPATTGQLPEGGPLPAGAQQGRTDYGSSIFGGACPPVGSKPHRYQLTIWALKVASLPLEASASGAMVGFNLGANALASATVTGFYGR
ncbi:MAG TPA: YbhB/YbcL family Raf kinase inhibitor-like protein [Alphaproteobacteria bacterium]|nr:YbhB/YbcL family Raf kinase inhibitor-like protein [Alphaproteobacteria bacterium]